MKIEIIFTKKFINFLSIIISTIIFLFINFNFFNPLEGNLNYDENNKNDKISKTIQDQKISEDENNDTKELENSFWFIEIPAISLKAPIDSGVGADTLKRTVGHFDETSSTYGNIGLAAHNRRI